LAQNLRWRRDRQFVWEEHDDDPASHASEWIELQEGKKYFTEAIYVDGGGGDHLLVPMEFKPKNANKLAKLADHPLATPTLQAFEIYPDQVFDQFEVTIQNPDSGRMSLSFKRKDGSFWSTSEFKANRNADQFNNNVDGFFQKEWGSNTKTTLVMYDAQGQVTEDSDLSVTNVYTVKMLRLINGFSTNKINVKKVDTNA
jgi:hypothetical protein